VVETRYVTPPEIKSIRSAMCSSWGLDATPFAWDNRWGVPLSATAAGMFGGDDTNQPPAADIFVQARRWWRMVAFIRKITALRLGFVFHGVLGQVEKTTAVTGGRKAELQTELEWHPGIRAVNAKDRDKLREWKRNHASEIQRVLLDIGREQLITRNVVCLWQPGGRVLVRPPEQCIYSDEFGTETLTIKLKLTPEQIKRLKISEAARAELLRSPRELKLTHESSVFEFSVMKEESVGMGFGWPDLATLFHVCSLEESLLVGDRQLAEACRTVYEQHALGHEIKSGPHAGSPAHFANVARREGTMKEVKEVKGKKLLITNFDHLIEIGAGRPEPNQYDAARYKAATEHMALWGVPYAQMWSGIVNPFLMSLARQDAQRDRQPLQTFLPQILREGMKCPVDVWVAFDDSCFWDSRMLLDLLKTGVSGGPISQGTFLRSTGFSQPEELARKQFESTLPKELVEPAYDAAHGPPKPGPGKPAGKNDQS